MRRVLRVAMSISLIVFSFSAIAQQTDGQRMGGGRMSMEGGFGILKGSIVDEISGLPIEYANIVIYKVKDSSLVTGGITDLKGNFNIDKIPFGRYNVDFKFIGYKNSRVNNVMITPRQPEVTLETIKLKSASENMEGIVVTGQKSMLQNNLDKTVINVDRNINVEGGTALDIMRNIPSVEVDVEGNVSVRGSSNLTILIDGRPSQITSLEELPANLIQSVELITNPSVRYDPDGLSGILNIVMVKKKTPGYHGMVSVNAGTGNKYSGTVNMNIRQGKLNYFGNIDFRKFASYGSGITNRQTFLTDTTKYLNQTSKDDRDGIMYNFRGGIDFFINPKNTLSFVASTSIRNFAGSENSNNIKYSIPDTIKYIGNEDNNSNSDSKSSGSEFALNYKKTFEKAGQEFTSDLYFSNSDRNSDEGLIMTDNLAAASIFKNTTNDSKNWSITFQSDLVKPIGNGGRLETGIKGIIRKSDGKYILNERDLITDPWLINADVSNHFILTDQIYAGYAIYSNTIGAFSYQGGIRVEDQLKKADQRTTDSVVNASFFNIFPSAHIKWDINKTNALQLSYSKRVNRPSSRDLNPFKDIEDPLNVSYGNPYLEPEFTDAYEIGHSLNLGKTSITSALFYRYRTNLISRKTDPISENNDTLMTKPFNLNGGSTLGAEFIVNQKITNWWRVNGNFSYFQAKIIDKSVDVSKSESNSWTAKATSSFSIGKNLEIQLNGNYRSPVITGIGGGGHGGGRGGSQGKTKEMYSVDLGLRYMVMNKKGTITLRVSDIFNSRIGKTDSWGTGYTTYSENRHESQIIFVGFSYRINDYKQRRDSRMEDTDNGDMDNQ
ncbi:MAG: TonB-dependent receptor [Bacteroidales bacterium]|nr:MAG: TonB-dependent receptor [Bacteroidales bacterium]